MYTEVNMAYRGNKLSKEMEFLAFITNQFIKMAILIIIYYV